MAASSLLFYSVLPSSLGLGIKSTHAGGCECEDEVDENEVHESEDQVNEDEEEEYTLPNVLPQYKYEVDMADWKASLLILTSMNRYAAEGTDVLNAGAWLQAKLRSLPNMEVTTDNVNVRDYWDSYNVIGTLKGTKYPEMAYVIGAHYDSISETPLECAPGALDNASGTVAVLEMARVFSELTCPFTLIFVLFTGEEHGLLGSKKFVQDLYIADRVNSIKLMVNMDMVALNEFILIESTESEIYLTWKEMAVANGLRPSVRNYVMARTDHLSFHSAGIRCVHTGNHRQDYKHYHKTTDIIAQLNPKNAHRLINTNILSVLRTIEADLKVLESAT